MTDETPFTARYCVNCRWLISLGRMQSLQCEHPNNFTVDMVTGQTKRAAKTPWNLRDDPQECGQYGQWWEPNP